jgi:Zn-dependent peptidase ImmA (M78 family)
VPHNTGKRIEAIVKPAMLIWARETAGLPREAASRKARVTEKQLEGWEAGLKHPTIGQLRKLATAYKRPLAAFYLPEPPSASESIRDFRRLPGKIAASLSPALRLALRQARYRRRIALELYEETEGRPPMSSLPEVHVDRDPEEAGSELREFLGITYEKQVEWGNEYDALNRWRAALERKEVLVFQATDVPLSEVRGFSIAEKPFPVVAANIKDAVRGRIFTILHELAHLMLQAGGLCDLAEGGHRLIEEERFEVFCNYTAGAALVPHDHLLSEEIVRAHGNSPTWSDEELGNLASRYKVSQEVILRRLLILRRTTEEFYRRRREEFQRKLEARALPKGFAPPHQIALSSAGVLYTSLVLGSYHRGDITASDLSDYLDVRLKHISKIEQKLTGTQIR